MASAREPRKVLYEIFEERSDIENDHYLCEKLGWRSVELMRRKMSAREYAAWMVFYEREAQRREMEQAS